VLLRLLTFALAPIPAIAIPPLLVLLFGMSTNALILVAFCAVVLPIATNLRAGRAPGRRTIVAAGLVFGVAGEEPGFFANNAGDFLPAPELLAGLLTIALFGMMVEAAFCLLERRTVVRWGMKGDEEYATSWPSTFGR
jgi:NitT/TauT family transport system permease protein